MPKTFYLLTSGICFFLLTVAMYLQHVGIGGIHYPPCPLCILQRIGFLGIGISALCAFTFKRSRLIFHLLTIVFAIFGLAIALRHAYVIAYPAISCGLDPLEVFINQFGFVKILPFFFKADGFCSMPLPPVLGLSVPNWSLIWIVILFFMLLITTRSFKRKLK